MGKQKVQEINKKIIMRKMTAKNAKVRISSSVQRAAPENRFLKGN